MVCNSSAQAVKTGGLGLCSEILSQNIHKIDKFCDFSWQSAYLTRTKPWVLPRAPHKLGVVVNGCKLRRWRQKDQFKVILGNRKFEASLG